MSYVVTVLCYTDFECCNYKDYLMRYRVDEVHYMCNIQITINIDLRRCLSTYKVFLKLFYFLLVALQSAVVHGSALDGDLPHLQVHLLQLKPAINPVN